MRPERMQQLSLLCKNEDKKRIIELLAQLKVLHITDHARQQIGTATIDIGTPLANAENLSSALLSNRNLLTKLKASEPEQDTMPLENRMIRVKEIASAYSAHEQELQRAQAQLQAVEQQIITLEQLPDIPLKALRTRTTHSALLKKPKDAEAITAIPSVYLKEKENSIFITVQQKDKELLERFEQIDLAPVLSLKGTTHEAAARAHAERRLLLVEIQRHEQELKTFSIHAPFLAASEPVLALELLKAQAPLHFGTTKHITLIKGFVPSRRTEELQQALDTAGIPAISELTNAAEAPTALNNRAKSFESLMNLYTLPKYNEIDPTSLMAFTFPIFFGFMLGDIGYGMAAFAVAYLVKKHVPAFTSFANIFMLSAAATIVFGIVFGEFFGAEQIAGFHLPHLIHRLDDLAAMFMIAVGIGVAHLNFGLVLGMINESHEGWSKAIIRKGSWMVLQVGVVLLLAGFGMFEELPLLSNIHVSLLPGMIITAIAIIGVWHGERIKGLVEIFSIFSNILSYTRLVALGLASVYLALVVNNIGGGMFDKGGIWVAVGVLILLIGHAINLVLGLFGPFIHSLRLHYVEFFMKFYEGGGKAYKPFGLQS